MPVARKAPVPPIPARPISELKPTEPPSNALNAKTLSSDTQPKATVSTTSIPAIHQHNDTADVNDRELFKAPPPANTTLGALEQLNAEFQRRLTQAEESDDSAKKRRYQRLVKQVNDAIKATKLNKPFNYDELNGIIPPGFSPIPLINGKPVTNENQKPVVSTNNTQSVDPARPQPVVVKQQQKSPSSSGNQSSPSKATNNPNLKELRERQALFKEAAIEAKRSGNDKVALLYLKNSKVCIERASDLYTFSIEPFDTQNILLPRSLPPPDII